MKRQDSFFFGALGCTVSHLLAAQKLLAEPDKDIKYALIMEDDMTDEFIPYWLPDTIDNLISALPEKWGAVQLSLLSSQKNIATMREQEKNFVNNSHPYFRLADKWSASNGAYLLSRKGAAELMASNQVKMTGRFNLKNMRCINADLCLMLLVHSRSSHLPPLFPHAETSLQHSDSSIVPHVSGTGDASVGAQNCAGQGSDDDTDIHAGTKVCHSFAGPSSTGNTTRYQDSVVQHFIVDSSRKAQLAWIFDVYLTHSAGSHLHNLADNPHVFQGVTRYNIRDGKCYMPQKGERPQRERGQLTLQVDGSTSAATTGGSVTMASVALGDIIDIPVLYILPDVYHHLTNLSAQSQRQLQLLRQLQLEEGVIIGVECLLCLKFTTIERVSLMKRDLTGVHDNDAGLVSVLLNTTLSIEERVKQVLTAVLSSYLNISSLFEYYTSEISRTTSAGHEDGTIEELAEDMSVMRQIKDNSNGNRRHGSAVHWSMPTFHAYVVYQLELLGQQLTHLKAAAVVRSLGHPHMLILDPISEVTEIMPTSSGDMAVFSAYRLTWELFRHHPVDSTIDNDSWGQSLSSLVVHHSRNENYPLSMLKLGSLATRQGWGSRLQPRESKLRTGTTQKDKAPKSSKFESKSKKKKKNKKRNKKAADKSSKTKSKSKSNKKSSHGSVAEIKTESEDFHPFYNNRNLYHVATYVPDLMFGFDGSSASVNASDAASFRIISDDGPMLPMAYVLTARGAIELLTRHYDVDAMLFTKFPAASSQSVAERGARHVGVGLHCTHLEHCLLSPSLHVKQSALPPFFLVDELPTISPPEFASSRSEGTTDDVTVTVMGNEMIRRAVEDTRQMWL